MLQFVLDATHNVIAIFGQAVIRHKAGAGALPQLQLVAISTWASILNWPVRTLSNSEECGWQSPVAEK